MNAPQTEFTARADDGMELLCTVLGPGEYTIGSDPGCKLRIAGLAPRHARLTIDGEGVLIEDLGADDVVRVDGGPITGASRVREGQAIQLGAVVIELRALESAPHFEEGTMAMSESDVARATARIHASPSQLLPPSRRGRYAVGGEVARGGMGTVLAADDPNADRTVAMKVMLAASDGDERARFLARQK